MNPSRKIFTGLVIVLIASMLTGCELTLVEPTPTATPTAARMPPALPTPSQTQVSASASPTNDASATDDLNLNEFEALPTIGIDTDKTAINQMIANILSNEPLDPCPVIHRVAEMTGRDNPTYLVYISAQPEDFFLVVIHTTDPDKEPYGSALFGSIVEGRSGDVFVAAEYSVPEGQDAPNEFEIQVVVPGCEIFSEMVSYESASSSTASPFLGEWVSTDPRDGSKLHLSISAGEDGYNVVYEDESSAGTCGLDKDGKPIANTATGTGTTYFNLLQVELSLYCMTEPQKFVTSGNTNFVYMEDNDTIDDGMLIWSRSNEEQTEVLMPEFKDDFDRTINANWNWVKASAGQWSLTSDPNFLNVKLAKTADPFAGGPDTFLLQAMEEENFEIVTRMVFEPQRNFQRAGLVIYEDDVNYVALVRAYADIVDYPGNAIYFDNFSPFAPSYGDTGYANYPTPIDNLAEVYLKLRREGNIYTGFYSLDGTAWVWIGKHKSPIDPVSYGLLIGVSDRPIATAFDYFELYRLP